MKPLLLGIAALVAISTGAEAADGCGRGMFYNGRRCVPQDGPGYGPPPYQRGYGEPRYERGYGPPVERGPQLRLDLGGRRDEGRYSPPIPLSRRSTTARRISQFKMACVSRTRAASSGN